MQLLLSLWRQREPDFNIFIMIDPSQIKFFDGDYEILYSGGFNIYENRLLIQGIGGFSIDFLFVKDPNIEGKAPLAVEGNNIDKTIKITLTNFDNALGVGTTKKIPIITTNDGRQIFFSLYGKSLNPDNQFKKVSVTFYIK